MILGRWGSGSEGNRTNTPRSTPKRRGGEDSNTALKQVSLGAGGERSCSADLFAQDAVSSVSSPLGARWAGLGWSGSPFSPPGLLCAW